MLWLVFFKLWEKATSGLRATVSAVIQNSGIIALLARAHSPAVRQRWLSIACIVFYHAMPFIRGN